MVTAKDFDEDYRLSESFWFNYRALAMVGFYPIDCKKNSKVKTVLHAFYSMISLLIYTSFIMSEAVFIIQNWGDLTEMSRVISPFIIKAISIPKIYLFWKNSPGIRWLMDQLDGPVWNRNHPAAVSLLRSIPLGSFLFALQPLTFCFLWLITTYTDKSGKMKLKFWIPEAAKTPPSNHLVLLFTMFLLGATGIAETAMNTMICGFMAHACSQLIILRESLQNIGECSNTYDGLESNSDINTKKDEREFSNSVTRADESNLNQKVTAINRRYRTQLKTPYKLCENEHREKMKNRNQKMKRQLVNCMNHHQIIVKFIQKVEEIFTWGIFCQFAAAAVIMCGAALQIRLVVTGSTDFFYSVVFASGMISELGIFCYFGDNIIFESSLLSEAIYHCRWTSSDVFFRKCMLIFMERTRVPLSVSAGKFFQLSRQTFVNVLKSSYSYYAVVKGMRSKYDGK